jgi:cytochrome c peroxidase
MNHVRAHGGPSRISWLIAVSLAMMIPGSVAFGAERLIHLDTPNPSGILTTIALEGNSFDAAKPFFQSLGTNGRSCVSCHVPSTGWTISPTEIQERFDRSEGRDPIFRTVDGSNSPLANVSTVKARRTAYSMLLKRGLIRVGLPIPAGAEFDLVAVDDPYKYASAKELSLFRRPLPTTNLRFLTGVMWDGRESFPGGGTTPILASATPEVNAAALFSNLMHQANDATVGHAQGKPLSQQQQADIATFELHLATAQSVDRFAGLLDVRGALGGPENLAAQPFYVTINDVLGADVFTGLFTSESMTLFGNWASSKNGDQAAIARGAALFGSPRINITGVGGLNDDLGVPTIRGSCTTCHDTPNVGNHSVALPIDIGLTDASRRTADMPLYTLRNRTTGQTRQTTDPARALLTGKWKDIGKMKGPVLRGLASRPPYFHDGSADDLLDAIEFYDTRFGIGFTDQEKADLAMFLNAL